MSCSNFHYCHAVGCSVVVGASLLMCLNHWRKVPSSLQKEVWRHYRPSQQKTKEVSIDYWIAALRAIAAVAKLEKKEINSQDVARLMRSLSALTPQEADSLAQKVQRQLFLN